MPGFARKPLSDKLAAIAATLGSRLWVSTRTLKDIHALEIAQAHDLEYSAALERRSLNKNATISEEIAL